MQFLSGRSSITRALFNYEARLRLHSSGPLLAGPVSDFLRATDNESQSTGLMKGLVDRCGDDGLDGGAAGGMTVRKTRRTSPYINLAEFHVGGNRESGS